jgi:hypothetical protein
MIHYSLHSLAVPHSADLAFGSMPHVATRRVAISTGVRMMFLRFPTGYVNVMSTCTFEEVMHKRTGRIRTIKDREPHGGEPGIAFWLFWLVTPLTFWARVVCSPQIQTLSQHPLIRSLWRIDMAYVGWLAYLRAMAVQKETLPATMIQENTNVERKL